MPPQRQPERLTGETSARSRRARLARAPPPAPAAPAAEATRQAARVEVAAAVAAAACHPGGAGQRTRLSFRRRNPSCPLAARAGPSATAPYVAATPRRRASRRRIAASRAAAAAVDDAPNGGAGGWGAPRRRLGPPCAFPRAAPPACGGPRPGFAPRGTRWSQRFWVFLAAGATGFSGRAGRFCSLASIYAAGCARLRTCTRGWSSRTMRPTSTTRAT